MTFAKLDTYTDLELALVVMAGLMGSGAERKKQLGKRYASVQARVNSILRDQTLPAGSALKIQELRDRLVDDFAATIDDILES